MAREAPQARRDPTCGAGAMAIWPRRHKTTLVWKSVTGTTAILWDMPWAPADFAGSFRRHLTPLTRSGRVLGVMLAVIGMLSQIAEAQVYRWTDDADVVYYTTDLSRIPDRYRNTVHVIDSSPRETPPASASQETILFAEGSPIVAEAFLNGTPISLIVDTGADRTVISTPALLRAGITMDGARRVRLVGATGPADALEVAIPRLDVAGTQVGPLAVIVHEIPIPGFDGLLGRDVLDGFVLTIDARRGRAMLSR
jgi:predicted aspartyl protease